MDRGREANSSCFAFRSPKVAEVYMRLFVPSRSEVKREDPKVKGGLSRRTSPTRGKGKNNTTQYVLDVIIFVHVL